MRILLVPGFAQTSSVWDRTVGHLPGEVEATALNVPVGPDFASTTEALGKSGGQGAYVGYSMGGRLVLHLALTHPEMVEHLVLVSAGPGIADPKERLERRAADEELADWIERHSHEEFLDSWTQQSIFDGVPPQVNRAHRLSSPSEIAGQLRRLGQGIQPSLWDRLGELLTPVTFVVGENDEAYREIAAAAAPLISSPVDIRVVPGAGHALIHEDSTVLAQTIIEVARPG